MASGNTRFRAVMLRIIQRAVRIAADIPLAKTLEEFADRAPPSLLSRSN
jgi:hypothetical protein